MDRSLEIKVFKECVLLNYIQKPEDSCIWQGILSSCEFLRRGACFKLRNGLSINLWMDPRIPWTRDRKLQAKFGVFVKFWPTVADLRDLIRNSWNLDLLQELCEPDMVEVVRKIDWPYSPCQDKLLWNRRKRGEFSVKSWYNLLFEDTRLEEGNFIWALLWKAKLHERLKLFLWRLLAKTIPTKEALSLRIENLNCTYVLCGLEDEICLHLFKNCDFIKRLAFTSQ